MKIVLTNKHLEWLHILSLGVIIIAPLVVLGFDGTHNADDEFWALQRRVSFAVGNIGGWTRLFWPIAFFNLGRVFRLSGFEQWYDYLYAFFCVWGMVLTVLSVYTELPWDGFVKEPWDETIIDQLVYIGYILSLFFLVPINIALFIAWTYKKLLPK